VSPGGTSGLEVVAGPASGRKLALEEEPLELGRGDAEKGALGSDPELSRRHARVSPMSDGRLLVEDLGSTNGTFVNGKRIAAPTVVGPGDEVALGDTTLRVTAAAASAYGGVHTLPSDLLTVLVQRAPVRPQWIVRAALTALPIVFAVNFFIRTIAVEYLDVRPDLPTMRPYVLFMISLMPTLGNSLGFYRNFGRPAHHSVAHYLVPTFAITLLFATIETILLPSDASAIEYAVTIVVAIVPPSVIVPTLLALRVRAELTAERELRGPVEARASG
jgi:FHA domain